MSQAPKPERWSLPVLNEDPRGWEAKVVTTLLRFHNRLERRMAEALGVHGLTLPQFDVLATLWHGEGITQQELAERLLVTKGTWSASSTGSARPDGSSDAPTPRTGGPIGST